ncbi:hypothetical protein MUK42_20340 [Musa troglodytarum]|uniref:Uncharacterized protein n=1 Tax=Musa troglodytarum TaxID=320322 RepID=A0A9E7FIR0_9LILI|nr:hypothetical protein MUK42_20340 [Musa troglodytarum]
MVSAPRKTYTVQDGTRWSGRPPTPHTSSATGDPTSNQSPITNNDGHSERQLSLESYHVDVFHSVHGVQAVRDGPRPTSGRRTHWKMLANRRARPLLPHPGRINPPMSSLQLRHVTYALESVSYIPAVSSRPSILRAARSPFVASPYARRMNGLSDTWPFADAPVVRNGQFRGGGRSPGLRPWKSRPRRSRSAGPSGGALLRDPSCAARNRPVPTECDGPRRGGAAEATPLVPLLRAVRPPRGPPSGPHSRAVSQTKRSWRSRLSGPHWASRNLKYLSPSKSTKITPLIYHRRTEAPGEGAVDVPVAPQI